MATDLLTAHLLHIQDEDLHEAVLALARMLQLQLIAPPKVDEHVNEQLTEKLEVRQAWKGMR